MFPLRTIIGVYSAAVSSRGCFLWHLSLERSNVAAGFSVVRPRRSALVGCQKVPREVAAAGWITGVNRRTARLQRHCLRGASVALQCAEIGILPIEIPRTAEITCTVAAEVVTVRHDRAGTVPAVRGVRDNTVLNKNRASRVAESPATADVLGAVAKSRIADL